MIDESKVKEREAGSSSTPLPSRASYSQAFRPLHPSYIACQLLGWGLWAAVFAYISARSLEADLRTALISYGLYASYGVIGTHLLRNAMRRGRWLLLPVRDMASRLLGAVALCIVAMIAALYLINVELLHLFRLDNRFVPFVIAVAFNTFADYAVWLAIYAIVFASRRRREAELERLGAELALRDAQYRSLSAQVNPHFLFNALNSLRALILIDPPLAIEAVTHLADLLRYSLNADREPTVPLEEELEIVDDYLALERLRFEGRLRVTMEIEPAALRAEVPRMMVQHLVENAVKHGIAPRAEGGDLRISARVDNEHAYIEVRNPGTLIINQDGHSHNAAGGSGLANTRRRLTLLYANGAEDSFRNSRNYASSLALSADCTLEELSGQVVARLTIPRNRLDLSEAGQPALTEDSLARPAG